MLEGFPKTYKKIGNVHYTVAKNSITGGVLLHIDKACNKLLYLYLYSTVHTRIYSWRCVCVWLWISINQHAFITLQVVTPLRVSYLLSRCRHLQTAYLFYIYVYIIYNFFQTKISSDFQLVCDKVNAEMSIIDLYTYLHMYVCISRCLLLTSAYCHQLIHDHASRRLLLDNVSRILFLNLHI